MAFRLTDGTVHYVDMDLCVPSVSSSNGEEYNGGIIDYLRKVPDEDQTSALERGNIQDRGYDAQCW